MLLVLDTRLMKFSIAEPPPVCLGGPTAIVEAGEGMTGIFALRGSVGGTFDLHYSIWGKEGATRREQMEKIIPLDHGYRYYIRGAMEKHLLLARSRGEGEEDTPEEPDLECFSLDVKTLQLEPVCVLKYYSLRTDIYTNFPPSLSPEIIRDGKFPVVS